MKLCHNQNRRFSASSSNEFFLAFFAVSVNVKRAHVGERNVDDKLLILMIQREK
jgi:hypothetical protein